MAALSQRRRLQRSAVCLGAWGETPPSSPCQAVISASRVGSASLQRQQQELAGEGNKGMLRLAMAWQCSCEMELITTVQTLRERRPVACICRKRDKHATGGSLYKHSNGIAYGLQTNRTSDPSTACTLQQSVCDEEEACLRSIK